MPYIKKNSIKDNVSLIHSHASISSRIGVSNLQTIDSFFSSQTQIRQQPTLDPIFEHIKDDNITIEHLEQQPEQQTEQQTTQKPAPHINHYIKAKRNNNLHNVIKRDDILNNLSNHIIKFSFIDIKKKIDTLTLDELKEIFKIILINNEKYSNNKNGIFINLNTLKKTTIQEINNFLYFSDNNKTLDELEEYERSKYKEILINN